jgi:hypothetical protein
MPFSAIFHFNQSKVKDDLILTGFQKEQHPEKKNGAVQREKHTDVNVLVPDLNNKFVR